MIILQIANHLNIKMIVGKTPPRSGNEGDANRPAVPKLNIEVTITLKYFSNFWIFLDLLLIN